MRIHAGDCHCALIFHLSSPGINFALHSQHRLGFLGPALTDSSNTREPEMAWRSLVYDCDLARTITDAQRCGSVVEIRSRARRRNCGSYAYRATHWLASVVLVLTLADLPWSRGVARAQQVIYHEESLYNRKVDENLSRSSRSNLTKR